MEILNLIPIGLLAWFVMRAYRLGKERDGVDAYFLTNRIQTGKRFRNFFGWPTNGAE
ncbi:MAG: hypothetical protein HQL57_08860 [Magnetococcales bacterium]|nr:hypothetical protein [Magnetococcales bacterium]MBF0157277.1 hypothetical protein [Magnetococcales bacterium]